MVLDFTDANFQSKVLDSEKLSVVDFWAEWCGPCRAIGPVMADLSNQYEARVNVGKVNLDHNPEVGFKYGVTSIPTILFIKNGQLVDKLTGAQPKANFVKKTNPNCISNSCRILLPSTALITGYKKNYPQTPTANNYLKP